MQTTFERCHEIGCTRWHDLQQHHACKYTVAVQDDAQKQFPHRLFASDAWDLNRLQEYQSLVKEIPEISQIVKGLRTSLGQDEDGTEGNEIDDLYGIDGFTEYFDLSGKVCMTSRL